MMTRCQIKTTESFIVRQHRYKLKGSEFYQTTKNDQGVRYTCKKGKAAIFKTQSQRTGSGNGELEILKWGTSKMGNL